MRINFECTGGYGGLFVAQPLIYRIESEDLPQDLRDKLLKLVRSSGLLDLDEADLNAAKPNPVRDAFNYKLSIRDQMVAKTFTFDDVSTPPAVRPLLNYLRELALEARRQ